MAHREFTDEQGQDWEAWDVRPSPPDRRRGSIAPELSMGWLAFRCGHGERRRIVPPPDAWTDGSDDDLRFLLAQADAVPATALQR